jgi:hypothetical protein
MSLALMLALAMTMQQATGFKMTQKMLPAIPGALICCATPPRLTCSVAGEQTVEYSLKSADSAQAEQALSRRGLLQRLSLLSIPMIVPAEAIATPALKKVWGVQVPLDPKIFSEMQEDGNGVRFDEVYTGIGITPSSGNVVRVQLTAFSMDGQMIGNYAGTERIFEVGKADMPRGVERQVQAMKIGAQRVMILEPEAGFRTASKRFQMNAPMDAPVVVFVKLLGIKGRPCSSSIEEREKGNLVDFHICGEVNERTEKIRLFCANAKTGVCVEPDYLKLQADNAAKGVSAPKLPFVGKY